MDRKTGVQNAVEAEQDAHAATRVRQRLHRFRPGAQSARQPPRDAGGNAFAQAEALAFGRTSEGVMSAGTPEWLVPHRTFEDNQPSATILDEHLTRETLGKLTAFYKHCVFTQARSGRLIRSTSGAWNSARSWPNASARYS